MKSHDSVGDLQAAIAEFAEVLPGWWYSMGDCSVSCHASCGPDVAYSDAYMLINRLFDEGFHSDIPQPTCLADALRGAMQKGLQARDEFISARIAALAAPPR